MNLPFARIVFSVFAAIVLTFQPGAPAALDTARLAATCADALRLWGVPGMSVAIVKDGDILLSRGFGVREVGRPAAVDEHTQFAIASNTKAFTATAMLILVERGKVELNDRITTHLPGFDLKDPIASRDLRVRDLLSHRSGLGTFSGDLLWYGTTYDRAEVVRRARYLEPAFPVRGGFGYQNVMYIAAGGLIAAASGTTWDDFVTRELLAPLGMSRTVTSVTRRDRENVATPHAGKGADMRPVPWRVWDNAAPAGGLISTAQDMSRWLLLQLGRGELDGRRYFTVEASRVMWTPQVSMPLDAASERRSPTTHFRGYGLGWSLRDYEGRLIAEHGGAYDGMFSQVLLVPDERLGIVVLTNGMTGLASALAQTLADQVLGVEGHDWHAEYKDREREGDERREKAAAERRNNRRPGTAPSLPLEKYAGVYGGDLYGDAVVRLENGALVLALQPAPELVADLTHWHHDTFRLTWRADFPWFGEGLAQFVLDPDGRIRSLKLDVPNDDFWFHELPFARR